jgi:hypothetical protein
MRQLLMFCIAVLIISPAFAQEQPPTEEPAATGQDQEFYFEDDELFQEEREEIQTITHAEFAMMVLRMLSGDPNSVPGASESFAIALNRGLIPSHWAGKDVLTYGELIEFLRKMGAGAILVANQDSPQPEDQPVSRDFVEVMLRRALDEIKATYELKLGGEGPYLVVSPSMP